MKKIHLITALVCICGFAFSQTTTQTVHGKIVDQATHETLVGATVVLLNSNPIVGTTSDFNGVFSLENVPVGRHSFEIRMLGYQNYLASDILVSSGKHVVLDISLQEDHVHLDEVVITANADKSESINSMATVSSRQFSVEQTQRFAGGMDDPARLVSSFAGVANPSISSNGISIRGNSPSGLLWRIEGVEVPSPNHFANLTIAGAGLLSALSSQVMGNSDFYTGAFPAEYGNATSGVFDIRLRNGNHAQKEYTLKAGLLGVEFATEGPLRQGKDASYLLNYRYSTLALVGTFLPSDAGILNYQDLSYKINVPTKDAGTFSLWGVGAFDGIDTEAEAQEDWETLSDRDNSEIAQYLYALGVNHKHLIGEKSVITSSLSATGNGLDFSEQRLDDELTGNPHSKVKNDDYKITLQSTLTSYIDEKHTNRTGFYYSHLGYNLSSKQSPFLGAPIVNMSLGEGQTDLFQLYSASKIDWSQKLEFNGGLHMMYFRFNQQVSLEPRAAFTYHIKANQSLALAYGLHSRIESLPVYFVDNAETPNQGLKLMKSNHMVLSYKNLLPKNLKLTVEPYYQYLTNVPVAPRGYVSTLNIQNSLYFDEDLINKGTARNVGVDVTVERSLHRGMYYLLSASFFDSKYTSADEIERNTRFNKNYVVNALIGKEWQVGRDKNNLFSANIRMNYLGGNRKESIDQLRSLEKQDVVYDEVNGQISFAERFPDLPIFSFTVSYRKNKRKHSSVWALQVLNASRTPDFQNNKVNLKSQAVEEMFSGIMIPNLSYRVDF